MNASEHESVGRQEAGHPPADGIEERLLRWEEARQQGKRLTADELCADCPQLANELLQRIRAVEKMEQVLGVGQNDPKRTVADPANATVEVGPDALPSISGYEILRVIDQGGMGVVYKALHLEMGRTVAIKMISGMRVGSTHLARFRAEVAACAGLQHPNFVQIFEVGRGANGRPFFSMEYVEGGSLAQRLAKQRLSSREAAELVGTLARAIHTAHERGIVHRDLKPSNVMLTADETPKIADFGLAKRLDDDSGHTQTGEVLGTPCYMAPEQASGQKDRIGPATDVYALGVILYEVLTGRPPFTGDSPLDTLRLVTTQEPVPPSRLDASIPPDLEAICLKCLEKMPAARYASARELAADLQCFLDGHPVTARRIGALGRMWKWVRRHPLETALAVAVVVIALLLPVFSLLAYYHNQRQVRIKALEEAPQVREILERNCYSCHNGISGKIKKNFDVLDHQLLLDKRRIVVSGKPDDSRLIQRIADGSMPPEEDELSLPRVTEQELAILRDWIRGGAPLLLKADPEHPTPPVVTSSPLAARVKEIFRKQCYECHKYTDAQGGIRIMDYRLLVTVRKVIVPGRPDESELFQALTTSDEDLRMPKDFGKPLPPEEIAIIRRWIEEGAPPFPKTE